MSLLTELVWSPNEGLSLYIAQSCLARNKASLFWNTDTYNMTISSPQRSITNRSCHNQGILENGERMDRQLSSDSETSKRLTTQCCQRSLANGLHLSPARLADFNTRSHADANVVDLLGNACSKYHLQDTAVESHSGNCLNCVQSDWISRGNVDVGSYQSAKSLLKSSAPEKEINGAASPQPFHCHHKSVLLMQKTLGSMLEELRADDNFEMRKESVGVVASSQMLQDIQCGTAEPLKSVDDMCIDGFAHFHGACHPRDSKDSHENALVLMENQPDRNNLLHLADKGKRKLPDDSDCSTNAKDCNNSIESCSSKLILPKQNRSPSCSSKMSREKKKSKKNDNESSCSGSSLRNHSSFFNWIARITNGSETTVQRRAATATQPQLSATEEESFPILASPSPLTSIGFGSLFQALYRHNIRISSKMCKNENASNDKRVNLATALLRGPDKSIKETLHFANDNIVIANMYGAYGTTTMDIQNHVREPHSMHCDVHTNTSVFGGNVQHDLRLACIPSAGFSPNSSNDPNSASSEDKNCGVPARTSNTLQNGRSAFLESSWVTRLFPKAALSPSVEPNSNTEEADKELQWLW